MIAGASHNTDIGPDSEAQISPNDEVDEKTHEHYQPEETHEEKKENGKHENGKDLKTNTSV